MSRFKSGNLRESLSSAQSTHPTRLIKEKNRVLYQAKNVENEPLIKLNTLVFVAIHELGHVMSVSVGHTDEFWNNMRYLLKHAIEQGIYIEQDLRRIQNPIVEFISLIHH